MGCTASVMVKPVGAGSQKSDSSSDKNPGEHSRESSDSVVHWKLLPSQTEARQKFLEDGTLLDLDSNPEYIDLRALLDDPIAQNALGKYANTIKVLDVFMCWVDIQEYKSIPTESYRCSKALHIYHKYIKEDAVLCVHILTNLERKHFHHCIQHSLADPSSLKEDLFNKFHYKCFLNMFERIYMPFKQTTEFSDLTNELRAKYNRVRLSHFEFYDKLGEGGFGFVVHCKKKSTGKHYAMKLQTKIGLLNNYKDDMTRANLEKMAFASCQHPFIVNLDYAFQTDSLAIMVLGLATAGDLNKSLTTSPNMRLSEERTRFYAAEIVLALSYLHQMGLIYRDLKPQNVLLNEDGHIQLVDLGGVMDARGNRFGQTEAEIQRDTRVPLMVPSNIKITNQEYSMRTNSDSDGIVSPKDGPSVAQTPVSKAGGAHAHTTPNSSHRITSTRVPGGAMADLSPIKENVKEIGALPASDSANITRSQSRDEFEEDIVKHIRAEVPITVHEDESLHEALKSMSVSHNSNPASDPDRNNRELDAEELIYAAATALNKVNEDAGRPQDGAGAGTGAVNREPFAAGADAGSPRPKNERAGKKLSVMGTLGYMAPEMVLLLNHKPKPMYGDPIFKNGAAGTNSPEKSIEKVKTAVHQNLGYTSAVDWWSFGVTIYKLLTGARPFTDSDLGAFVSLSGSMDDLVKENAKFKEYTKLFKQVSFPDWISPEAKDLITKLLTVDDRERLGTGKHGVRNIKKHPFFASIDWNLLELKHIEPPFKPEPFDLKNHFISYPDLPSLLAEHGKSFWLDNAPPEEYQKYFLNWNFTSPHTIRVEAGLSSMMDQYDRNFKVRRVMGSVRQASKAMADAGSSTSSRLPEKAQPTPEKAKQRIREQADALLMK